MFADRIVLVGMLALLGMQRVYACDHPVGSIVSMEGTVEVRPAAAEGQAIWIPARLRQPLCVDDQIAVRERSRAAVELVNQVVVRLDQHTTLTLQKLAPDQPAELGLIEGIVHVLTRFTSKFSVITPYLNAMVEGTEFTVVADTHAQRGQITVAEGKVRAVNQNGEQLLLAGNTVTASAADVPPAPLTIKPRDAIQWALYFPQIVSMPDVVLARLDDQTGNKIRDARALANRGQYPQALAMLGDVHDYQNEPTLHAWYVNLLLSVGRVDEAREALGVQAGNTTQLPLRSLIETVLGNSQSALQLAQQAIAADAKSVAAQLAVSLALQSQGEIAQATAAAQRATELDPGFPLAWVRLAELELLNANARQGRNAAEHALQLEQDAAKAHTVIGFANIMAGNFEQAQQAFERAKQSEAPDAQAWLGSGLVLIHNGQLADGRQHLEIAAMLDPGNAELRNILTRAYLKEGRDAVAVKELGLAERLDPANPGPWFTDALRKQQLNDPVGALQAYQRSLELNDQRAVVRPRTLLDQDKAGRMLSLASTYRDLGFDGLMLSTAERAVTADPSSSAAHAFLAEAYSATPRYETARVSEQLQAQLRAPIGMAPVAPQSLLTTLPIVGGARTLSLQEFTPLVDRNNAGLALGALYGTQTTRGSSASAFKAWDNFQISAGHFYYDTDSAINDVPIRLSANNLLFQWQLTPGLQTQLEGRTERREGGDVTQRINPLSAEPERRRSLKNDSARFGLAYEFSTQAEWLLSAVRSKRLAISENVSRFELPIFTLTVRDHARQPTTATQIESQGAIRVGGWQFGAGLGFFNTDSERQLHSTTEFTPAFFPLQVDDTPTDLSVDHRNVYVVATYRMGGIRVDTGVQHDEFKREDGLNVRRTSGKFGGEYVWDNSRIHAAIFSGVKGSTAREQSLDFTQFAGFTQVFEDPEGTSYRRVAAAFDHAFSDKVTAGVEWSRRKLNIPDYGCNSFPCFGQWQEQMHRLYSSWAISRRWAAGVDAIFEGSHLEVPDSYGYPIEIRTWQAPIKLAYFPFANWRINIEWRGVKQAVRNQLTDGAGSTEVTSTESTFGIANFGLRYGRATSGWSVALELNNAFDRQFRYQDTTIAGQPIVPLFTSERSMALRCGLRF
jgi:tetratricopeptide (TPR) repeat protein